MTARICAGVFAILLLHGPQSIFAATREPEEMIRETVNKVLEVLRATPKGSNQRRARIEQIAREHFDLDNMSRKIIGRHLVGFSDQQQTTFLAEFPRYLANYYLSRVDEFENEELDSDIRSRPIGRAQARVSTTIVGGRYKKLKINYDLRERPDRWVIIDVEIDGISVVSNFKEQCSSVIEREGTERLLSLLLEKNANDNPGELDGAERH